MLATCRCPTGVLQAAALLLLACLSSTAQPAEGVCNIAKLSSHLANLSKLCCSGQGNCKSGVPTKGDSCSATCAPATENFVDECGAMLKRTRTPGYDQLHAFYLGCLDNLYRPGSCGDQCSQKTLRCRLKEMTNACCTHDAGNCPTPKGGSIAIPHKCPLDCALSFPSMLNDCQPVLKHMFSGKNLGELASFSRSCTERDPAGLVEYAKKLLRQGCRLNYTIADTFKPRGGGGKRRRLRKAPSNGLSTWLGLAKNSRQCSWDDFDNRLLEVDSTCCTTAGTATSSRGQCSGGNLPKLCSASCAIVYHSFYRDCQGTLGNLMSAKLAQFRSFDARCTSKRSVSALGYIEMIRNATCFPPCPNGGTDMQGRDVTPTNGDSMRGTYCNVRTFSVGQGVTVRVDGHLIMAADSVVIAGTLSANGSGYSGGARPPNTYQTGFQGLSVSGKGTQSTAANGGGGGGGHGECRGPGRDPTHGRGGGGGGYGSAGANGQGPSGCFGAGGVAFGSDFPSTLYMGGGGGAGGNDNVLSDNPRGGKGGNGGGIISIFANTVAVSGLIVADGADGQGDGTTAKYKGCGNYRSTNCHFDYSGAGGGGAGGSIYVRYSKSISYVPQLLRASGGSGGRALNQNSGGNGGKGRIVVQKQALPSSTVHGTIPIKCANEHKQCKCQGEVSYGMASTWTAWRPVKGSISCSNSVFGDPLYGTFKMCQCRSAKQLGCANNQPGVMFSKRVFGCPAAWSVKGLSHGSTACAQNWHICKSAAEASTRGVTAESCRTAPPPGTFYATLESSSGGWNCNNDAHGRGTNDIWGCAKNSGSVTFEQHACSVLNAAIGNKNYGSAWVGMSGQASTNELNNVRKIGTENGGVMCCKN